MESDRHKFRREVWFALFSVLTDEIVKRGVPDDEAQALALVYASRMLENQFAPLYRDCQDLLNKMHNMERGGTWPTIRK